MSGVELHPSNPPTEVGRGRWSDFKTNRVSIEFQYMQGTQKVYHTHKKTPQVYSMKPMKTDEQACPETKAAFVSGGLGT